MNTQVYLNEAQQWPSGPPALRLAVRFDLPTQLVSRLDNDGVPIHALGHVFEQLNIGGDMGVPAEPWTIEYRHNRNRSLSVGDVVVIGECAFSVESFGWRRIPTDELCDSIDRWLELAKDQRAVAGQ